MKTFLTIINLLRPIAIVVLAIFGAVFADYFFNRNLFLAIIAISLIMDIKGIKEGFVSLYNHFFNKP